MEIPFWLTKLLVRTRLAQFSPRARRLTDGSPSFLRYYSDRALAAPVADLLDPAVIPDASGPDVIDLNSPSLRIQSGLSLGRFATDSWSASPSGLPELRRAIAARYRQLDDRSVNPETDVHIAHGATGALAAALEALVNPGDGVVLFDPSSIAFSLGAKSRRAKIRWVSTWTEEGRCRFLTANFERAMRSAKLLILSNPCNPSGGCLHDEDLEYIAWIAAAYDVLIYADESFGRFQFKGRTKSFGVQAGADRRILTAGSLTQEFGLGALRVGWLAGPRQLVRACGMMANLNAPYVPVACQQAAARALSEADKSFPGTLDRLRGKRDYTVDRLKGMGLEADCPAAGFYLWVSLAALGMDGRAFAQRLFRGHQVQVGPGCAFGPSGSGHIRLCFATDDGRLREGLARMAASVQEIQKKPSSNPLAIEDRSEEKSFEAATNGATAKVGERPQPAFSRV